MGKIVIRRNPLPLRRLALIAGAGVTLILLVWALLAARAGGGEAGNGQAEAGNSAAAPVVASEPQIPQAWQAQPSLVDYERLDARLQQLMSEQAMVGLAVAVIENGEIRFIKGYGTTQSGGDEPVTVGTVFRWASLSKGVAADMVALLAERGQLSLNDPVNRWSATLRLPGGDEARATIVDLLSHTLGIHGHAHDARLESGEDPRILRGMLAQLNQSCSPGTCHAYQNVAYDAASEIVERITGQGYEQALRDNLFLPLGMTSASASRQGLVSAQSWARPHRGGRGSRPEEVNENYYRVPAAGGVNGSIMDLALWMRAQMGTAPTVLPPQVLAAVQMPRVATPGETRRRARFRERTPQSNYALGWRVFDYAGHRVVGHHGGVLGYRSMILFDPARGSGVVALWNSGTSRPNGIEYEVMDMIYGLPFQDWLQLDSRRGGRAAPQAPAEEPEENAGSGEGRRSGRINP